jgi:hypothetical protein
MKTCAHCNIPITVGRYCKDPICREILTATQKQKVKERYSRTYKKKKRLCPGCKENITDLWPKRTCGRELCKLKWEHKKKKRQAKSCITYDKTIKYPRKKCKICGRKKRFGEDGRSHICSNPSCIKKWEKRLKKKRQKMNLEAWHRRKLKKKELLYIEKTKAHENLEYIDKIIDKINKPNGKICNKCKRALYGNYHRICPICLKEIDDVNLEAANNGYW